MKLLLIVILIILQSLLIAQNRLDSIVADIDHNTYKTACIGGQIWMSENLKTTHFSNGDAIPLVTSSDDWFNLEIGAWCNYKNADTAKAYGHLYNWFAVTDSRNVCPTGWHIPSVTEWNTLDSVLAGDVANKLNLCGFSIILSGFLSANNGFEEENEEARWWTANRVPHEGGRGAFYRALKPNSKKLIKGSFNRTSGCSVRCVKD